MVIFSYDSGVLRVDAHKAVGFVTSGELSTFDFDNGESFGSSHAGAVPPVSTDGSAGDVWDVVPDDLLINVRVTLQHSENIVAFKERDDLAGVGD